MAHFVSITTKDRSHVLPPPRKKTKVASAGTMGLRRASTACETCRVKKVKCNEEHPVCGYCQQHGYSCEYRLQADQYKDVLAVLAERLSQVEQTLATETLAAGPLSNTSSRNDVDATLTPPESIHLKDSSPVLSQNPDSYSTSSFHTTPNASFRQIYDSVSKASEHKTSCPDLTPLEREEARAPLPAASPEVAAIDPSEIMQPVAHFYHRVHSLWPVVCEKESYQMAVGVKERGFQDNLPSCLILLVVALSKAYQSHEPFEGGLSEFQKGLQLLNRIGVKFTLEFAQAHVLAAGFFLKMGRLLDFWSWLHMGCTILYKVIHLDAVTCRERTPDEKNSTLRLFWLCYNLERDLNNEFDIMPSSPLLRLEDTLHLPTGCNEVGTAHLPEPFRTIQTFFLAEMGLKSILARIIATPNSDLFIEGPADGTIERSPLFHEHRTQLDQWVSSLPKFVNWDTEPRKGELSLVATRLKIFYWFALVSLFKPLILYVLRDPGQKLPFAVWKLFQDGLLAGLNMIKISVVEETDVDVIVGNRLISTIKLLNGAVTAKDCLPTLCDGDINLTIQKCLDVLQRKLAYKSEWIAYRLDPLKLTFSPDGREEGYAW